MESIKMESQYKKRLEKEFPEKHFDYLGKGGIGYVFSSDYKGKKATFKILCDEVTLNDLPFSKENIDLTQIKHPNLMEVYEVLPSGIIIAEQCGNINLEKRILKEDNSFLEQNLIAYWDLLHAVKYLVENNLSYSDLKPVDIMFSEVKNSPKIIDFDTLRRIDNKIKKEVYHIFGSPLYFVPEILQGTINEKTDVFSLGNLLYFIITKKQFFEDEITDYVSENYSFLNYFTFLNIFKNNWHYEKSPIGNNDIIKSLLNKMRKIEVDERIDIFNAIDMFESAMPKYIKNEFSNI